MKFPNQNKPSSPKAKFVRSPVTRFPLGTRPTHIAIPNQVGKQLMKKKNARAKKVSGIPTYDELKIDADANAGEIVNIIHNNGVQGQIVSIAGSSQFVDSLATFAEHLLGMSTKVFQDEWRDRHGGTDEFFSTSLSFQMLSFFKANLNHQYFSHIGRIFDTVVSAARMNTEYVGIAYKDINGKTIHMQHPTKKSDGLFRLLGLTGSSSLHQYRDRERQDFINKRMSNEIQNGSNSWDVMRHGVMASIEFSLYKMVAPITADNVEHAIHSEDVNRYSLNTQQLKLAQLLQREQMKMLWHLLNGTTYTYAASLNSQVGVKSVSKDYDPDVVLKYDSVNELSPSRLPQKADINDIPMLSLNSMATPKTLNASAKSTGKKL